MFGSSNLVAFSSFWRSIRYSADAANLAPITRGAGAPSAGAVRLWCATLEHLMLALIDVDASAVMKGWKVDLGALTVQVILFCNTH
jgi:hypothetical protein